MKNMNLRKSLIAAAVGGALAFSASSPVFAVVAPQFTYDLDGDSATNNSVVANSISGVSSETLQATSETTFAGSGWIQFTSLNLNSVAVDDTQYKDTGLFALFSLTTSLVSGGFGQAGSEYTITSLTFDVYRDFGSLVLATRNVFTQASAGVPATVVDTAGDDELLAKGSLVTGEASLGDVAGGGQGQASLNAQTTFALETLGEDYFTLPDPFYEIALQAFNSTGGSWSFDPETGRLYIANASGIVDFQRVPEPESMVLVGLGLLGLGLSRRRKQIV